MSKKGGIGVVLIILIVILLLIFGLIFLIINYSSENDSHNNLNTSDVNLAERDNLQEQFFGLSFGDSEQSKYISTSDNKPPNPPE